MPTLVDRSMQTDSLLVSVCSNVMLIVMIGAKWVCTDARAFADVLLASFREISKCLVNSYPGRFISGAGDCLRDNRFFTWLTMSEGFAGLARKAFIPSRCPSHLFIS